MVDFDEVRKEVAIKHGILLDENDPMLITITMNEVILSQYVEMIATQNAEYAKAVEAAINAAIQKGIADSKLTAGRVITEGSEYVNRHVKEAIALALKEAKEEIGKDLIASKKEIESTKKATLWAAVVYGVIYAVVLSVILMKVSLS